MVKKLDGAPTLATALDELETDLANALAEAIKSAGSNVRNVAQG